MPFEIIIRKALYPNIPAKKTLSIRETIDALNTASMWVIVITFALLVSSLVSVAAKMTFFYNKPLVSLSCMISDVQLFVLFCLIFLLLTILYMRLYLIVKRFDLQTAGRNDGFGYKMTDLLEDAGKYKKNAKYIFPFRILMVALFVVMLFLIGHDYEIKLFDVSYILSVYQLHDELLIPSISYIMIMIMLIELPVWYIYALLNILFDDDYDPPF